ncbi:protein chiffon [Drosophila virilis]|uniref:protein chiffon n=1 Tax=Drosophila virilis TaxID=7244 RepID=UPI00139641FB|nr:protein chiffon [Drosophila virilis]
MQPQSDKQSASKSNLATARANTQQQPQPELQQHPHQRSKVKVIKSKRPLCHFKFYLDICDHQLAKRIEADIKALGGTLEFFLNDSITHFITDKEKGSSLAITDARKNTRSQLGANLAQPALNSPQTPNTPITTVHDNGIGLQRRTRQTRADAILSRVRAVQLSTSIQTELPQQNQQNYRCNTPSSSRLSLATYTIWQTEYALRFFQRIQTELRQYLKASGTLGGTQTGGSANIHLKGHFIKIESIKRNHRPYYHLLKQPEEWPKIDLSSEDSAFRLQTKAYVQSMTRKSPGSRTSQRQQDKDLHHPQAVPLQHAVVQALKKPLVSVHTPDSPRSHCRELKESSDKQCGVCEICKIEYDTLTTHLQSKEHELFAKNVHNFVALDTLIQVSASVNGFLKREQQKHRKYLRKESEQADAEINSDMEVDELLSNNSIASATKSPNQSDSNAAQQSISSGSNNNNKQRPSPALREKSKRITKGKHSSEKFRATANTSPNQQTPSPVKKIATPCSLTELQRVEETANNAATAAATPSNPTRRKTQNSVLSPPIRAMLPPSSLYKVVEASDALATSPRIRRGATNVSGNVMDSPSLIVKFQKVRQSELQRLNGEAENFMFPRTTTRSSSELPTDVDRQTTSDARGHHGISSPSLDSTSEVEVVPSLTTTTTPVKLQNRATAVGRRRKGTAAAPPSQMQTALAQLQRQLSTGSSSSNGGGGQQQRFPNAPIQPEMQPQLLSQRQATATRKSSRMATAIVTAATTSSQLQLRRRTESTLNVRRGGNLEDRVGEQPAKKDDIRQESDEPEDEESNDESSSSGSDEDYIAKGKLRLSLPTLNRFDTREERAARRLSRLTININRSPGEKHQLSESPSAEKKSPARRCSRSQKPTLAKAKQCKQQVTPPAATKKTLTTELIFDCRKSERLQKLRYAFEKSPDADLWHRVFQRQDAGEEQYYSYYGSTRYCKLPYELGPIPMDCTSSHNCTLCRGQEAQREIDLKPQSSIKMERQRDMETEQIAAQSDSNQTAATTTSTTTSSMYRHKKMHLLQRYQQEQQQQQQQQQQQHTLNTTILPAKCDSKASTPELLEREFAALSENTQVVELVRATSTQSNSSSSCSNSQNSGATCRNKQLARIAELPPRKSPREHASTLALVSCIIRQRQDSQSKTNSEVDEPSAAPPANLITPMLKMPLKQEPVASVTTVASTLTSHNTRSQAATPVEELRFATEISETVKRMRRGQNKYDTLPPTPSSAPAQIPTPARCRRPTAAAAAAAASYSSRLQFPEREITTSVMLSKRKRRQLAATPAMRLPQQQPPGMAQVAGVRKLPSKKGQLEYEMEANALKTLNANIEYVNPLLISWQIDKYLELTGREYDLSAEEQLPLLQPTARYCEDVNFPTDVHTPPPTDFCFTSEFDLCDLLAASAGSEDDEEMSAARSGCRRNSRMNLYCSYQRKRKCLKSNRTGWPRAQRRRATVITNSRVQPSERVSFRKLNIRESHEVQKLQDLKQEPLETEEEQTTTTTTTTTDKEISKEQDDDNYDDGSGGSGSNGRTADNELHAREVTAMTPPTTDVEEQVRCRDLSGDEAAASADNESQAEDDDDETMADSVDQLRDGKVEIEATDADVEEDDGEDDYDDAFEDSYGGELTKHEQLTVQNFAQSFADEPPEKRIRIISESPAKSLDENHSQKKTLLALQTSNGCCLTVTSTPNTQQSRQQQQQQQRRTPQLNGSLGSCISPSEKLGDNSDVFTVSSDGLETDMDLSNTQAGDSLEHCSHQRLQQTTPKRKFDISKYAPPNNAMAASSCAAEAATAAVKSLAISQFLKKETCAGLLSMKNVWRRTRRRTISAAFINATP